MTTTIERPDWVRVHNGNKFKILGRFNGEDYEFLPGKSLDIPLVVAQHIFDFGRDDKSRAFTRLGWMQTSDQLPDAEAKMAKMRFTPAPPLVEADMVEETPESDQQLLPGSQGTGSPVSLGASGVGGRQRKLPASEAPGS